MKPLIIAALTALLVGCMPKSEPIPKQYTVSVAFRTDTNHTFGSFHRDEVKWPNEQGLVSQLRIFCDLHDVDMNELMTNYYLRIVQN